MKKTYLILTSKDFYSDVLYDLVMTQMPVTYQEIETLKCDAKRTLTGT